MNFQYLDDLDCEFLHSSFELKNSINENEMNFQYLDDLDCEFLHSSFELKETVFSLKENSTEKTSSNEKEAKET